MAKKQQVKSKAKKGESGVSALLDVNSEIGRGELSLFSVGLVLLVISLFLLVAFTSYLYSGAEDYSALDHTPPLAEVLKGKYCNICGAWGAMAAFFFINKCFGLASYIIPIYFILLGMRMMNVFRLRMARLFILFSLLMIWLSVALAAVGQYIPDLKESFLSVGGNHGQTVVDVLTALVGQPGLYGLLLLFALFYLIYISKKTVEYVQRALRLGVSVAKKKSFFQRKKEETIEFTGDENGTEAGSEDQTEASADSEKADADTESKGAELYGEGPDSESDAGAEGGDGGAEENPEELPEETAGAVVIGGEGSQQIELELAGAPEGSPSRKPAAAAAMAAQQETTFTVTTGTDEPTVPAADTDTAAHAVLTADDVDELPPYDPKLDLENYKYPPLTLLEKGDDGTPKIDMDEQNANKDRIQHVLRSFGVEISSIKATIGPTVTLYEITPAEGVPIRKIRSLADDISLNLAAEGIRLIAPIPGKGTVGIEVPNKKKSVVSMESILSSKVYQNTSMELPCALGKTITNEVFMVDLAKAPHLLVAGATGMGKSVGLNAIVTSLLYKKHPAELKIVMVDPKKVEFSIYSPIENHFLAKLEDEEEPIITDVQKVVKTLNSLCVLMDHRYDMLKKAKVRNIKEYNAKFKARHLNPMDGHEFMPYVVVIIDEYGDLIMTAGKDIELPICRIAQLARAVGIHMIIATQRPTASIITGTIKANFPARISFRVSGMMDSRIILDRPGADKLIGRGDMLYSQGGDPVRVQCAFVDTPEVSQICNFISTQQSPLHALYLPEPPMDDKGGGSDNDADMKHLDPMFAEVAKLIVSTQQGSTSLIQRKFSIGYNRAGRLMDQLEKAGVVGPTNGAKPRDVLISDLVTLDSLLNTLG